MDECQLVACGWTQVTLHVTASPDPGKCHHRLTGWAFAYSLTPAPMPSSTARARDLAVGLLLGPSPTSMVSFVLGLFVSILILSLVFASRLRPASRAPLLFRPDTNIQVLLDLKYNLSAEGISCITCSGEQPSQQILTFFGA